ncbi:MAG: hypothetical protein OCD01_02535 [Fibrobacterales bacterium]
MTILKLTKTVLILSAFTATSLFANSFSCYGEAEGMLLGADLSDAETFIEMQLANEENLIGQQHCVIAELMKRLGNSDAEYHYQKAIAMDPDEPGWELWYANYLTQVRGSMVPLREQGKLHYLKAIEKLNNKYGGSLDSLSEVDQNLYSWIQRGYSKMYQEDGIAITPWTWPSNLHKAESSDYYLPELFITYTGRYTKGLSEFDKPDYARSRASEAVWVKNAPFRDSVLSSADLERIATHDDGSDFYNQMVRLRLRHPILTLGLYTRLISIDDGMIPSSMTFNSGNINHIANNWEGFTNLNVLDIGVVASRNFNLYPLFDVHWEAALRAQERTGFIEWYPNEKDASFQFDTKMKISRFIGPDKVILDLFYMNQNIQDVQYTSRAIWLPGDSRDIIPGMGLERDRYMWGIKLDYALYRPVRFPFQKKAMYTRGWHWYAGIMFDSEKWWGIESDLVKEELRVLRSLENKSVSEQNLIEALEDEDFEDEYSKTLEDIHEATLDSSRAKVQNTDIYFGTHLKGISHFDFQIQGTYFYTKPWTETKSGNMADESLHYAQIFAHVLTRFIDEDVVPGMPGTPGSFISPVFLQLSVPASYDFAIDGPIGYENKFDTWKAQGELQAKLMVNPIGTYIILTAGGGYQHYPNLDVGFPIYSGSVNVGWKF